MVNSVGKISAETMLISAMKVAEIHHRYIANNIANADTPGYTQRELDFQKSLDAVLQGEGYRSPHEPPSPYPDRERRGCCGEKK
jgi:flagellar basal body rod protein FlgB